MFRRLQETLRRNAGLLRGAAVVIALVLVVLLLRLVSPDRPLAWLQEQVAELGIWGPVLYVLLYVAATALLLPSTPIAIAGGAIFGIEEGAILISIALVISAALSFLVGRYLAHDWATRSVQQYSWLRALYRALGRRGGWKIVVAVRVSHALPFGLQNLFFGATPIRFWPYLLATWLTMSPGAVFYAYAGNLANEEGITAEGWWLRGVALLIAAAALGYVGHVTRRALQEEKEPTES